MKKKYRNSIILFITAFIWGTSFVAQSAGGETIGPFAFNCIRCLIGSLVLLPVIFVFDRTKKQKREVTKEQKHIQLKAGLACGIILFIATSLQQYGMYCGTDSGKAGFLTAVYIVIVPILGFFLFKRRTGINVLIAVVIAIVALYFLCIKGEFGIHASDMYVIACSLLFALHILVIDKYSPHVDGLRLSCMQFFVTGVLSLIPALFHDCLANGMASWMASFATKTTLISIFYSGVMSCGVAYTLQIIGQDGVNPTVASLIMSMESLVAVFTGWLVLHETLTTREKIGCVLMMIAIILAQLDFPKKLRNKLLKKQ